jgi:hypothetical protein
MNRSATHRILATVVAVLTLGLGFLTPSAAQAATGYRLNWVYGGGGTGSLTYSSQHQWLADATRSDERAYSGASGVVKLTMTDLNNGAAVTALYDSAGIHTYSNGNDGQSDWEEWSWNADCTVATNYYGYETFALASYLTDLVRAAGGATIFAAPSTSGNVVGGGSCGTV